MVSALQSFQRLQEVEEEHSPKVSSKMKAGCDLEQPWVGQRGMSTEREHCLKVSTYTADSGEHWTVEAMMPHS